jgi:hypothetical protein
VTRSFCVRFLNRSTLACAALALALAASGCGDDSGSSSDAPADDPETVAAVTKKIGVAAGRIANSTPDRNLPGPYTFKTVCLTPDEARSFGTPRESVQCHIEAFTTSAGGGAARYVWSEDWRVPVQDGQLGAPEIVGDYRIRNFLRKDHRLDCSGGKTPQERCTGVYRTPPGETGIPGGAAPPAP